MRNQNILMLLILMAFLATGCASMYPIGSLYTDVALPVQVAGDGDTSYTKEATIEAMSIAGLIATGDLSIRKAAEKNGIKKIKFVDYDVENILGIIGTYRITIYGD